MNKREHNETIALVPVKGFAKAKSRLAEVLTATERATLAEAMLRDVVAAATACNGVQRVILLGGLDARKVAAEEHAHWLDDGGAPDLNEALGLAAASLAAAGVTRLVILPGDLPTLSSRDISALLACHEHGLTIRPAHNDGGTNALVLTPPDAMGFHFGPDSARRHMASALAKDMPAQKLALEAFARDIDGPADLRWLSQQTAGTHTSRWLARRGLEGSAGNPAPTALQA